MSSAARWLRPLTPVLCAALLLAGLQAPAAAEPGPGEPGPEEPSTGSVCSEDDGTLLTGDFAFVLDESGSMGSNDRNRVRVTASQAFVERFQPGDRGAVVGFTGSGRVIQALTGDVALLRQALSTVRASGGTNISAGVQVGLDQLDGDDAQERRFLLLLSDGAGSYSHTLTDRAAAEGVVIYTVGLGRSVPVQLLTDIAERTGGRYLPADRAEDLPEIFEEIAEDTQAPCPAPVAEAGGPYSVPEGGTVLVEAGADAGVDPRPVTYAWDLDGDGAFETSGRTVGFDAAALDGPAQREITVQVCNEDGECGTDSATVDVVNVAPDVDAGPDLTVLAGQETVLEGRFVDPAGDRDAPYATRWLVDGQEAATGETAGEPVEHAVATQTAGPREVTIEVADDDGGTGRDVVAVQVLPVNPVCTAAAPTVTVLHPPNHKLHDVAITGVVHPDGLPVDVRVTAIRQDEPLDALGDGSTVPDGYGVGTPVARLRAERSGTADGRVYHVLFEGTTTAGGSCTGVVTVGVPHDRGGRATPVDQGPLHDSTLAADPPAGTPYSLPQRFEVQAGTTLEVPAPGLLAAAVVPDGAAATVEVAEPPAEGELTVSADGAFRYVAPVALGRQTFTVVVRAGDLASAPVPVTLDVLPGTPGLHAPDRTLWVAEDTAGSLVLTARNATADAVLELVGAPEHGTAHLDGVTLTYVPEPDGTTADEVRYRVVEPDGRTAEGTVRVTVTPSNDIPRVAPVAATTAEDTPVEVDVRATAEDPEQGELTFEVVGEPRHGTAEVVDGVLHYTPAPDAHGTDRVRWRAVDEHGAHAAAWAEVTVTEVNDAPVPGTVEVSTYWDAPLDVPLATVLDAASPGPENEADQVLTVAAARATPATHGTVELGADAVTYTPDGVFSGAASFEVEVCDDGSTAGAADPRCAWAAVDVTVEERNRAPQAVSGAVVVGEDEERTITLHGVDPDGDPLTYTVEQQPTLGTLAGTAPDLTYRPAPDANGTDEIVFVVHDGALTSESATVVVSVLEVNDPPVPGADRLATDTVAPVQVAVADLLVNDVPGPDDEAHQQLRVTAVAVTDTADGTVTLDGDVVRYVPTEAARGRTVALTYTVCDDGTTHGSADPLCADGELLVDVALPGLPLPADDAAATREDEPVVVDVLANDGHEDGLPLELVSVAGGTLGEASVHDGAVRYEPAADRHGDDRLSYTVRDEHGTEATAHVDVQVVEVNDPPLPGSPRLSTTWVDALAVPATDLLAGTTAGPHEDGQTLTVTAVDDVAAGTVALAGGTVTYTPDGVTSGEVAFRFEVCDDGTTAGAADPLCSWGTATVDVTEVNRAPVVRDAAISTTRGVPVTVDLASELAAQDPDGDDLTFAVGEPPAGGTATIAGTLLTYVPAPDFTGTDTVRVTATDGALEVSASLTVTVSEVSVADLEVVPSELSLLVDEQHPLGVRWTDGDGAVRTDGTGVAWASGDDAVVTVAADGTVTAVAEGAATVTARLGGRQATARVTVVSSPVVDLVIDPPSVTLLAGDAADLRAFAVLEDGSGREVTGTVAWEVTDPSVASVDAGRLTAVAAGATEVVARLGDVRATALVTVAAPVPDDGGQPAAVITAPAHGDTVTGPVAVTGTATDPNLLLWELQTAPVDATSFVTLADGTAPVVDGVLGTFDATTVLNGQHVLRLRVTDRGGRVQSTQVVLDVDGGRKVGPFTLSFADVDVPVAGIPLTITRTYDSRDLTRGDFGVGWRMGVTSVDLDVDGVHGEGWTVSRSGGILPTYTIAPARSHRVSVLLPDGRVERFEMSPSPASSAVAPFRFMTPGYVPVAGTRGTLEVLDGTGLIVTGSQPGTVVLLDDSTIEPFDPRLFRYTSPEGTEVVVHADTGVRTITDPNGNRLTVRPDGLEHSTGASVRIERDAEGRVTSVTDPAGGVQRYGYDDAGNLVTHTDAAGHTTRMRYDWQHNLLEVVDPLGRAGVRNEYDEQGRLVATTDAYGARTEIVHDDDNRRQVLTDRLGRVTVRAYDDRGNVLAETLPDGSTVERTYDAHDNQLSATDALGRTVTRAYDADGRLVEQVDAEGNTLTWTYDAAGRVSEATDADGNVTSFTYDAAGNVLTETTDLGTTTHTYDGQGNRLTTTTASGAVHRYGYDAHGNAVRVETPDGAVQTSTYDANGNELTRTLTRRDADGRTQELTTTFRYDARNLLVEQTDPAGRTTRTEYDGAGQVVATVDGAGRRTELVRDLRGQVVRTVHPDGTTDEATYDALGKRLTSTDRGGRTTAYAYDGADRLTTVTHPDGTTTTYEYDDAGRQVAQVDELGNRTSYGLDDAGRRVSVTDPTGAVTRYVRDGRGNVVREVDPEGRAVEHRYDALGNVVLTTYPDGTTATATYDGDSRLLTSTDQAGRTTSYGYDGLGRLTTVTDPLGGTTTYEYDEAGNKIRQTDANGRVTTFDYDAADRLVSTVRPSGRADLLEYDAADQLVARTDLGGRRTTHRYDLAGRLVETVDAAGATVTRTYAPSGTPATVTDARGTTTYRYDDRDRLVEVVQPDGRSLTYTYDAAGRRTSVSTPETTTTSRYDAAGRLVEVGDGSGAATFAYDTAGLLEAVEHANGVRATYHHDDQGRLTGLDVVGATGDVLFTQALTLGAAGQRTAVVEGDRSVDYAYDAAGRLVGETVTASGGTRDRAFTYDAVGNRLREAVTDAGGTSAVDYTYDVDDRLVTYGAVTVEHDADGNLVRASGPEGTVERGYDLAGRLVSVADGASTSTYEYDADGVLVATEVDGVRTDLLVDANREHSQVLAEYGPDGGVLAEYLVGDVLLASSRAGSVAHHHGDVLGSTRVLTDASGAVTDTYAYEAFGEVAERTGTTTNPYLFAGERFDDAADAYQLRARWYTPETGRFVSMDPFAGVEDDPVTLHRYLYAHANPLTYTDPSGEMSVVALPVMTLPRIAMPTISVARIMAMVMPRVVAVATAAAATCAASLALSAETALRFANCDVTHANIFFSGADTPETTQHIVEAIGNGYPARLTRQSPGHSRSWLRSTTACAGNVALTSGKWCDEYPFASTREGGEGRASVKLVSAVEQMYQGGKLSAFYLLCNIRPNDPVRGTFAVVPSPGGTRHVCGRP